MFHNKYQNIPWNQKHEKIYYKYKLVNRSSELKVISDLANASRQYTK